MTRLVLALCLSLLGVQSFSLGTDTLSLAPDSTAHKSRIEIRVSKLPKVSVPILMVGYGFTSLGDGPIKTADKHIRHELREQYPHFSTNFDDKLQYAPTAAVYALNLMGIKGKNNMVDRTALLLVSNAIMGLSVNFLKVHTAKLRPSGSDRRSFPSGHTATAFVGAEFLRQEFKDVSPVYGYIGYSLAGATGVLRMMNNKHWLSDVLTGAGIGILSTKFTYFAYPRLKNLLKDKKANFLVTPTLQAGNAGFSASVSF